MKKVIVILFAVLVSSVVIAQELVVEVNSPYILANIIETAMRSYEQLQTMYKQYQQAVEQYNQLKAAYESWIDSYNSIKWTGSLEDAPVMFKYMIEGAETVSETYNKMNREVSSLLNAPVYLFGANVPLRDSIALAPTLYNNYINYLKEQSGLPPEERDTTALLSLMNQVGLVETATALTDLNVLNENNFQRSIEFAQTQANVVAVIGKERDKIIGDMSNESSMAKNIANLGLLLGDVGRILEVNNSSLNALLQATTSAQQQQQNQASQALVEENQQIKALLDFESSTNFASNTSFPYVIE